ncbi:hypothetical protein [uncultured Megasphaera sp.]|uniref:hypothetical protein n=1 Tax=uncultured Megasphaera sp. TaxID=165188 RepID=UPI00266C06A5|nr:hypothetical protein [uncultured Megasphaera sp.]
MHKTKRILSLLVFSCVFFLPGVGLCTDSTIMSQNEKIEMSLTQYNQLKTIISEQETTLVQLQSKLNKLDSNSTSLQTQLTIAREQLMKTKQSLTTADSSLNQANESLNRQKESLTKLTEQINEMTKKDARIKRQRDTWAVVAGALLVGCIVK